MKLCQINIGQIKKTLHVSYCYIQDKDNEKMNVIVIDCHPIEDGRIKRHIEYLMSKNINVIHVNFDFYSSGLADKFSCFSHYGEKGIRINYSWGLKKYIHCISGIEILKDTIKALKKMNYNENLSTIIHVHDPYLLPLASKLKKNFAHLPKIVYDRHEVYERSMTSFFRIPIPRIFEILEKKKVSGVITVSDTYKPIVSTFFPKAHITSVPNYPVVGDYDHNVIEDKIKSFNKNTMLNFVYIGSLSTLDRDIDLILKIAESVLNHHNNTKFILGGRGGNDEIENRIIDFQKKHNNKFVYLGEVSREKVIEINMNAQLGFLLIDPDTTYWVKTSPNKIFEYLICGIVPIIRADIEQNTIINDCSLIFDRHDPESKIIKSILDLIDDPKKMKKMMEKAMFGSNHFTFDYIAHRYIEIYGKLNLDLHKKIIV